MARSVVPFVALAAVVVAATTPAAVGTLPARTTTTSRPIERFAMDGQTAAYAELYPRLRVATWNVRTGRRTVVGSAGAGATTVSALALAGRRVTWIGSSAGNTEYVDTLYTASLPRPHQRRLARAQRLASGECPTDPRCTDGTWMHGLVGAGGITAVSRWTTRVEAGVESISNQELDAIAARGLHQIVKGSGSIVAASVDGGRVAVLRPSAIVDESQVYDGADIGIYDARGTLLNTIRPPSSRLARRQGRTAEVVLRGPYAALLAVDGRLSVYDWRTGKLLRTRRLAAGATHVDLYGNLAAYLVSRGVTSRALHLVRLSDGRDIVYRRLASPPATLGFVGLDLSRDGLTYAWDGCDNGCYGVLRFEPMVRVRAALSRRP